MHGFVAKLVVGPLVLHVAEMCECIHLAQLLSVACGTGVPIFHVEMAREADVLIGPCCHDVGIPGSLLMLHMQLIASWDVRYCSRWVDVWHQLVCSHRGHGCSGSTAATSVAAMALTTISTTSSSGNWGPHDCGEKVCATGGV